MILTREGAIGVLDSVLIAPATRTIRDIPTEVVLDAADGMPVRCALSFDNLLTVSQELLTDRITRLPAPRMRELCDALAAATGC